MIKGARGDFKAFTLVEIIVVVTILAILGLISFISIQGFILDTRDAKRLSDVSNLITKITMENSIGIEYSEIINEGGTSYRENKLRINGVSSKNGYQNIEDPINRKVLKENEENFRDPTNKHPYPFAYAIGNSNRQGYNFIQLAYVSEKTGATKLVGNYYEMLTGDSPSLFTNGNGNGTNIPDDYIIDGGESIYESEGEYIPISNGWTTPVSYNGKYRSKPASALVDTINSEWNTDNGVSYTVCNYNSGNPRCFWSPSISNGGCHGNWATMTTSVSTLGTTQYGTPISGVNIPFSSNTYQLNGSCGGINKYPAMKICQRIGTGWRLPTVFELGYLCYDSTSCSNARTALSLESYNYWSSTEYSNDYARPLSMDDGDAYVYGKTGNYYVVCVHD